MKYSKMQLFWLVVLRVLIGWNFLFEGLVKLTNPNWSSVGYLLDSEGFLKGFYYSLASSPEILKIVDLLNIWGLILIGLGLMIGAFSRAAIISGITLLGFYYLSHPPFVGLRYALPMEGSYLVVSKILIEMVALIVLLLFPTSKIIGVDKFFFSIKKKKSND
ncbi:MAG: DoxX family membrane protein [Bacteroidales bacterium]|nr:DoxX family membrane protein [Bacteroidales bacterium]